MVFEETGKRAKFSYEPKNFDPSEENRLLKQTVTQLKNEVDKFKTPALMVAEITEVINNNAIVSIPNGNKFFVQTSQYVKDLKPGDSVLLEQKNLTVVERIQRTKRFNVEQFVIIEKPHENWEVIGGLNDQKRELREVIELPLMKPQLFKKVGIHPPKGVLLYGPPGTGKTLLAKAVAASTKSTFIEIVGSELVQKFIGEGAKLVKEIFQLARDKAPSVIFIDEIDALASQRVELGTSGEREVQRTLMQLLAEIDGFKNLGNVKIIGCTNRRDILDPAIIRPGRLERQILVPEPDLEGIGEILKIHTTNMNLDRSVAFEPLKHQMVGFSGAEIKAACTEAGYYALRKGRTKVHQNDFLQAVKKVMNVDENAPQAIGMFG